MYSNSFLTRCPMCETVLESPRIHLHSAVTCARCFQRFTAEENYVDIEETFVSSLKPVEDKEVHKGLEAETTENATSGVKFNDFARLTSFNSEEHYKGRLDWTLVSSMGLQEGTETIAADKEASNDNVRSASFDTREHGREKPVAVPKLNEASAEVSIKEVGFWQEESKTAPGDRKSKKRKHNQSLPVGIALRKPCRLRRKVRSYSPSRESGSRKRKKLGLGKGNKVRRFDCTATKKYRVKGGDVENQPSGRNQRDFLDGDVNRDKSTTKGGAGKLFKQNHEAYFEEFKNFLTAEIKRQLGGLGEESKRPIGEVQVIDVEEVLPQTPNSVLGIHDAVAEGQQFIAKVKVMATIFIPITLSASEHCPAGSPEGSKSRENSEKPKGREVKKDEHKDREAKHKSKGGEVKEDEHKGREAKDECKGGEVKEDQHKGREAKDELKGGEVKEAEDEWKGGEVKEDKHKGREAKDELKGGEVKEAEHKAREAKDELKGGEVKEAEHKGREGKDDSKGREAKEDKPKGREGRDESKGREEDELKDREGKDESKGREVEEDEPKGRGATEDEMELEPKEAVESDRSSAGEPLFKDGNAEFDVPDSEFYDFDFNRSEDKFAPGQIWAAYDNLDVMPRDYLEIKKVVSIKPFKVQIDFLEPASGSRISCGEYRLENRIRVMDHTYGFSHLMRWDKKQNGMIHIYPAKKEVWALYKNWRENDPNRRIKAGYDIVEIVSVKGDLIVSVIPLLNFKGSRTVFHKTDMEPFEIHKEHFFRFSHQIATYEIIGHDGVKGCLELDPAAMPSI